MISSNIKMIMKKKKKTLRGLAREASISDKTLDRARGPLIRESRMSTLEAIAKALGVKVKDLFEEVEEEDVTGK